MSATGSHTSGGNPDQLAPGVSRIGAELRAARQRLGRSLPEVADTLRIRPAFIEAIEDGRLADLPGNVYAVGFIRSYAASLGLDANEVARRFRAEEQAVNRAAELSFPAPVPDRGVPAGAVVLLGVLVTVGAYAAWYRLSGDVRGPPEAVPAVPERLAPLVEQPPQPPPPVAGAPSPADPAPPAPPAPALAPVVEPALASDTPRVILRLKADAYIHVRERQGPVLLNRVMRGGETWVLPSGAPLLLTTGNAGGTELVIEGTASPALGPSGAVRRDLLIDPDTIPPGAAVASTPRPPAQ